MVTAITEQLLNDVADRIVRAVDPECIILFGSQAKDRSSPRSDVDLIVIERESFASGRSRWREAIRIRESLRPLRLPVDVLVFSHDEVEHWRGSINHVLARGLRQGRMLYERS